MTVELIIGILAFLTAAAGVVRWWLKGRQGGEEAKRERALNAEILKHQKDVRLSIEEAERRAEEGRHVADRALAGELSDDERRNLRSGRLPKNG